MNTFVPHNVECEKTVTYKIAWYKASSHDKNFYKCNFNSELPDVILSENTSYCGNTLCDSEDHKSELDAYFESLIYVLLDSSTHIPHSCAPHQSTRIPGWNELVKPYREFAIFWKCLHGEVGRPTTGWVAQIMRSTRAEYHYAIKCSRSQNEQIKKFKVMHVLFSSDRDLFKEVRKIRGHVQSEISSIDGILQF